MRTTRWLLPATFLLALAAIGCATKEDAGDDTGMTVPPGSVPPTTPPAGTGGTGTTTPPPGTGTGTTTPPPTGGGAGTGVVPPTGTAGTDGMMPVDMMPVDMTGTPVDDAFPDPRGKCGIDSGFPGDEACMLPPAEGEGFQIHVGPTDYNDPNQINQFVFHDGDENSLCWNFHTPNNEEVWYQSFVLSGRPGTHHIINTMYMTDGPDGGGFQACRDGGTGTNSDIIANLPGASKAYMPRGVIAPENEHLGRKVPPNTFSQADMHYFNFTGSDILREFWMNVYTVPKEGITGEATQIRGMGGIDWSVVPIAMGTDMVYQYEAPITGDGRIISLLGHYHAHGKRFTAFLNDVKVFEMYDYLDPQIFQYNSITTNPVFSDASAGATSGILEVKAGDVLKWECHIINDDQPGGLRYVNEVNTGEMCNLWGESVGPRINCVLPFPGCT